MWCHNQRLEATEAVITKAVANARYALPFAPYIIILALNVTSGHTPKAKNLGVGK